MSSIQNFSLQTALRYEETIELVEEEPLIKSAPDHEIFLGNVSNILMLQRKDGREKQIKNDISFCRPQLDWLTDQITQNIFQFLNANELHAIVRLSKPLAYHVISDPGLKKKFLFSCPTHITLFSRRNTYALKKYASYEKLLAIADTHLKMAKVPMDRPKFVRPLKISKKFQHLSKVAIFRIASFLTFGKEFNAYLLCCKSVAMVYFPDVLDPKNNEDDCSTILCKACCIIS
jgi:hypothetical protein